MPTLQIDLDDNASAGLDEFNAALDQMAANAANTAKSADQLTAAQQRNLIVMQAQKTNAYDLQKTYISVFGDIATTGIRCFQAIEVETERFAAETAQVAIKAAASVAKFGIVTTGTVLGLKAVFGKHTDEVNRNARAIDDNAAAHGRLLGISGRTAAALGLGTAAIGSQSSAWSTMGSTAATAGTIALKVASGIGPQIAGATLAWKGYEAVLARTGERTIELEDGTKKVETNLDRLNAEFSRLGSSAGSNFEGMKQAATEWFNETVQWPQIIKDISKSFDESVTRGTDQFIQNIRLVDNWFSFVPTAQREASAKIEEAQKRAADGIAMLKRSHDELAARQEYQAERQRIASIATVAQVNTELTALREKTALVAAAGKFDSAANEEYQKRYEELTRRRAQIEKEFADKSREYQRQRIQSYADEAKAMEAMYAREIEVVRGRVDLNKKLAAIKQDTINAANREAQNVGVAAAKDAHEDEKDRVKQQLEARGATETQIKSQLAQMDRQFAQADHALKLKNIDDEARARIQQLQKERAEIDQTGGNRIERQLKKLKNEEETAKAIADYRKKQIAENGAFAREWNKIEVADKRQAEQAKFAAEKERMDKVKALQEQEKERLKGAINGQDFLNAQDPQKVLRQLQQNRALAAGQNAANQNADLWLKWQAGDVQAGRKYDRAVDAAMSKARRSAVNDFNNGNLQQGEVTKAQSDVGEQTIQSLQNQGQLTGLQGQAISENIQSIAILQQQQQQQGQLIQQLLAAARGQKQVLKQSTNTTQSINGGLL